MLKRYMLTGIIGLAFSILMLACNSSKKMQTETITELKNTRWVVKSIEGNAIDTSKSRTPFIVFREDAKMGGNSGCNSYGGSYTLGEGTSIRFSQVFSTKMACMDEGNPENTFFTAFNQVNQYQIADNELVLGKDGQPLIVFISTGAAQ